MKKIAILGAGFQGVCVALACRKQGYDVTLIDKMPDALLRASQRNEGKVHMGFVYAKDKSLKTGKLMMRSALAFSQHVDSWLDAPLDWSLLLARPFVYGISADTMEPSADLHTYYDRLQTVYDDIRTQTGHTYLGTDDAQIWRPIPRDERLGAFVAAAVQTSELALNLPAFHHHLRDHLHSVTKLYQHTIRSVERTPAGFRVGGERADGTTWQHDTEIVVNCLWEGRLKIDHAFLGTIPTRPWVYRLKYRVLGTLPETLRDLPSFTFVLGRYGDIVTYDSGRVYLSWYPAFMRGWSSELTTPQAWEAACNGSVDDELRQMLVRDGLAALDEIVPGIGRTQIDTVDAGIIFSWGKTDIDDRQSELHNRYEIGVQAHDGYFSIDTGKYTSAPLFAYDFVTQL